MSEKRNLSLADVSKEFGQGMQAQQVLKNISMSYEQGVSYAVVGVSGSGKSTLLHLLGGLDQPTTGVVSFGDCNLETMSAKQKSQFLNTSIGFVFQFHYLLKELSVIENIMLPGMCKGQQQRDVYSHACELLDFVGLLERKDENPTNLSGGQQQRVAVVRALINKPAFVLADEPTGNLDADNAAKIVDLFLHAQKRWNIGIIVCSHDNAVYGKMQTLHRLENGHLFLAKD
ncbi:MAG: ABC transporter ATP-binding protein [Epsilonproteobacteria bacterium]|nr:ABC transporter ATP-binding protein [Campylobacterota bacterium]